ncbi:hypothetical protein L9F63_027235 [Diploptera punctata]|uniref:Uncharacterized protein n=1 Tax=Diploptera punctata TaxID=6984 RepID=A0AAD8ADW9_DIPPU|nr:hypothetical protein L9F63_027235 [Diploptera punctata]
MEYQKSQDKSDGMTETKDNEELYNIHWDFPALIKRSWSHIAKFALDLPSSEEERPVSSPATLSTQKHSVPVSPAVPVVPTETTTLLDMAAVRRQHKVGVSRQDSRLSVKSLIESIENATKQAKAGPGSRSSSTSSLSSIASGAPPTPTSPRRRLASETPLRDQQQTTNTAANKIQPLRKNTLSEKPSSQDEEVSAPNPVSILANKTMDFVRRNSYGDLSERKDPLSGLVKNGGSKRNALLEMVPE